MLFSVLQGLVCKPSGFNSYPGHMGRWRSGQAAMLDVGSVQAGRVGSIKCRALGAKSQMGAPQEVEAAFFGGTLARIPLNGWALRLRGIAS